DTDPLDSDSDNDGLLDGDEVAFCDAGETYPYGSCADLGHADAPGTYVAGDDTSPLLADTDGDGLDDAEEIALNRSNPLVADTDGDGLDDYAEINYDGDATLYTAGLDTDPARADTDSDGLGDGFEVNTVGTDPLVADSDGDGLSDGFEVGFNGAASDYVAFNGSNGATADTDPLVTDTDGDGRTDGQEVSFCDAGASYQFGTCTSLDYVDAAATYDVTRDTNPLAPDTDADGLSDGLELGGTLGVATNPLRADSDSDGLGDAGEIAFDGNAGAYAAATDTDPLAADTDGDGLTDGFEVAFCDNGESYDFGAGAQSCATLGYADAAATYTVGFDLNPLVADTDGGGAGDYTELHRTPALTNPLNASDDVQILANDDEDGDGLLNGCFASATPCTSAAVCAPPLPVNLLITEACLDTDPFDTDTDNDGLNDNVEIA
ncbi:MAG: hypothetical protein AAB426_05060, partial [Myxococcota bacterium]